MSLAGESIEVHALPGAEDLVGAFIPAVDSQAARPTLRLALRLDSQYLAAQLGAAPSGSRHSRLGRDHLWTAQQPRQLQRLALGAGAEAELVVDASSILDGAIRARPAVDAISVWAASQGIMPLHASALARNGQALLMIGEGGSGKTTTALALAMRGWQLIADDRAFLEVSPLGMVVHGLYRTAILTPTSAARLEAGSWGDLQPTHEGKWAVQLPKSMRVATSATLRGVVALTHGVGEPYLTERLTRPAALAAWQGVFAPALQAHGPTPTWLANLASATRRAHTWGLTLGWQFDRLERVLGTLLDDLDEVAT